MTEIWKGISGFSGYEVSNRGRVRSIDRVVQTANDQRRKYKGRVLEQAVDGHGYHRVCVWEGNKQTGFIVHRLVVEAFIREIGEDEEVNHVDCNKSNNAVDNLEIGSHAYNMAHAALLGRMRKGPRPQVMR